jgi:hypothetical protein
MFTSVSSTSGRHARRLVVAVRRLLADRHPDVLGPRPWSIRIANVILTPGTRRWV